MRIAVIGAGAWGTALATALSDSHDIRLWARNDAQRDELKRSRQSAYLPGIELPAAVSIASTLQQATDQAELNLIVTPTAGLRDTLSHLTAIVPRIPVVWACKGFDQVSGRLPHQLVAESLPEDVPCGALSGPSFALEVARGQPAALTLAAADETFAHATARALHQRRLRVYSSTDVVGVEIGGAVKNVMAIATGIADGLGLGLNARAALITRGLAEMTRLGIALGGQLETFMGLAGVGDLILTCTGDLSRNRRVGLLLSEGRSLDSILAQLGHVAEGVHTARAVEAAAKARSIEMPITRAVCSVLFEGIAPSQAVEQLLGRDPRAEGGP